jgi:tetratricopeptide (TPR) repeat protein
MKDPVSRLASVATSVLLLALLGALPAQAGAQEQEPARPSLSQGADTNSATAYYQFGLERVQASRPGTAADAFYWASRLAPDWADPLYARWVALILADPYRLVALMDGVPSVVASPQVRRLDSLELRALQLDPLVYEDLDREIVMAYLTETTMAELRRSYRASDVELARQDVKDAVDLYLRSPAGARWRAWLAYAERRLSDALRYYAEALAKAPEEDHDSRSWMHTQRGRAFFLSGHLDSARVELGLAIDELRHRDESVTSRVYESKALLEYCLGIVLEGAGDVAGAREAYGRALVEDLAFSPAHVRLGRLLAASGDTAGARKELEQAVELAPDAPVPRLTLANRYFGSGDDRTALATLEPLLQSEPYWVEPYLLRGLVLQRLGDREGAATQYAKFLALSEATDDRRAAVTQRLAALRGQ